ncbi:hypothetical protein [Microbacterium sp. WCS2018Hpa-9]|uniref:hypothetical protein n=1 Tax=Microbacterium sp. WCS2018Hpa-9 TaxID=3073635 RepID=UPI0028895C87|nr:hypothetical protein [Microbacterium sp. WCS2018Hpa-9]
MTARRTGAAVVIVAITLGQLLGCAPEPSPVPTPTPAFASEAEAFAAAEEVYRAYNDALNEERIVGGSADPGQYLSGLALESHLEAGRYFEEQQLRFNGEGIVDSFNGDSANLDAAVATVTAFVCLDVSQTRVIDGEGADVTPSDRPTRLPLEVVFVGPRRELLISNSNLVDGEEC